MIFGEGIVSNVQVTDPLMVDYLHDEIADMTDDLNPGVRLPEYVALAEKVAKMSTGEKYAILEKIKR
ncbi:hypothetical protein [Methylicorpusculum sp.]|uniref:hypothetical protein n=1 Tax=Methylicorpusculum sp. TaxID=2713644 RepID=UPI00272684D8|nr:hypothetical protein [Methylicorpusculum sp.]MDO8846579.1 hypothetical protein [Methylicorpusculum sp.]